MASSCNQVEDKEIQRKESKSMGQKEVVKAIVQQRSRQARQAGQEKEKALAKAAKAARREACIARGGMWRDANERCCPKGGFCWDPKQMNWEQVLQTTHKPKKAQNKCNHETKKCPNKEPTTSNKQDKTKNTRGKDESDKTKESKRWEIWWQR